MLPPSNLPSEESLIPERLFRLLRRPEGASGPLSDCLHGGIALPGKGILE